MATLLSIETATNVCSAAIITDNKPVCSDSLDVPNSHSSQLIPMIDRLMKESGTEKASLSGVVVSSGPGSYTGLRIGSSTAKGLAYSLEIPLISVSTLEAMAFGAYQTTGFEGLVCPMIDARRMEVYCSLLNKEMKSLLDEHAHILDETSFKEFLLDKPVLFFGNGANKFRGVAESENAHFLADFKPDARWVGMLGAKKFDSGNFADVAYFEPNYLKEYRTTTPSKNKSLVSHGKK